MTPHPFDSEELGPRDPELDSVGARLERYAADAAGDPPRDLAARIQTAVSLEADRPRLGSLLGFGRGPGRVLAAVGLLAVAVLGALVVGQLANLARDRIGASPSPSVIATPSEAPTPTPTPTPTPSASPTPSSTMSPSPTPSTSPSAPATVDATPEASDDHVETPRPSGTDNSGPGGGGGNSGPGGGGGSSGPGGG